MGAAPQSERIIDAERSRLLGQLGPHPGGCIWISEEDGSQSA